MKKDLNREQKTAVFSPIDTNVLVVAPAGTGKTEVLVSRILYLLENSVNPEEICAITYTNLATNEMIERIREKFSDERKIPLFMGTTYSLCEKMLRYEIDFLQEEKINCRFTVIDRHKQEWIIRKIKNYEESFKFNQSDFIDLISDHKISKHLNPKKITDLEERNLVDYYIKYQEYLKKNNELDFDDLLIYADRLLEVNESLLEEWRNKFKSILVDECQDLTLIQFNLITKLIGENTIFFGVGDPHQCIFLFNGAKEDTFERLEKFFEGKKYLKVELKENYRSSKKLVEYSNKIKKFGPYSIPFKETEGLVVEDIKIKDLINKLKGEDLSKWAIIFRKNTLSKKLINLAIENKIPFKVSVFKLLENREIQSIIAYLRLIFFDNFNSFWTLFNKKNINLTEESKREARDINTTQSYLTVYERWMNEERIDWFKNEEDNIKLQRVLKKIKDWRKREIFDLSKLAEELNYYLFINDENLSQQNLKEINLFIKWLDNIQPEKTLNSAIEIFLDIENKGVFSKEQKDNFEDGNYLTLITIHMSKGLGWENVAVLDYENLKKSKEEDKFLEYVSVTRAKEKLYLVRK